MKLNINGKETNSNATTLAALITELRLEAASLVVEHNAHIVPQKDWETTSLQDKDCIELLNFVGGG